MATNGNNMCLQPTRFIYLLTYKYLPYGSKYLKFYDMMASKGAG